MSAVTGSLVAGSFAAGWRGMRRLVASVLVVGAGVLAGPIVAQAQAAPVGTVTNYTAPSIDLPNAIATGPDGALWFTGPGFRTPTSVSSIGRISVSGTVTSYTDPSIRDPFGIVAGPDGALWFTNQGNNSIG